MSVVTARPNSLREAFSQQVFSDEEKARLGKLLADGRVAGHVVRKYIVHTTAYRNGFRKQEKIRGFRPATRAFDKQAIPLIIRCLRDATDERHHSCWDVLYKAAALTCILKELPNLDRLLTEVPSPSDAPDSAALIRAICINAMEFGVCQNDVRRFYDLWGTPRIDKFDDLLPLCLQRDETVAQRRAISNLSAEVERLKVMATASAEQIRADAEANVELRRLLKLERAQSIAGELERQSLAKTLTDFQRTLPAHDARIRDLEGRVGSLAEGIEQGAIQTAELSAQLRGASSEAKSSMARTVDALAPDLRRTLSDGLTALREDFDSKLAKLVAVRPAQDDSVVTPDSHTGWCHFDWTAEARPITDDADLRRTLSAAFKARGVTPAAAIRIHSALAAGVLPIIVGPNALLALDAYGHAVCGARSANVHITPSVLEAAELFGKIDSGTGRFVTHAAGLLDMLRSANGSRGGAALVTLEGINRAPTESYLLPLLQMRASNARIPLFHPRTARTVSAHMDPYVVWPRHLWLAATTVEGPTSLPISRDLLAFGVVIEVDSCEPVTEGTKAVPAQVGVGANLLSPAETPSTLVDELLDLFPDSRGYRGAVNRFGAMLARFESDQGRLRLALLESVLLPLVATLEGEDERREAFETLTEGLDEQNRSRLSMLCRRLRRRIA